MKDMVPVCYLCGKIITGRYYKDWAGHCVCATHPRVLCSLCGQFCDKHARDIGRGMKVCTYCQKNRIEQGEAEKIIKYVQRLYSKTPIGQIHNWKLKMVNAEALYQQSKDPKARGLAQSAGDGYTIFILRDLTRVAFASTLAHEMLHIYQFQKHLSPIPQKCEGFCNLGSYVILESIGNAEAKSEIQRMMNDPSQTYGKGFRYMLMLYKSGGWNAAIKSLSE